MAVTVRVTGAVALLTLAFRLALPAAGADLQWAQLAPLPPAGPAFSVTNDPLVPSTAYVATMGSGLLRTEDGKTWSDSGGSSLPKNLWRVAIDPANGPKGNPPIYVGAASGGFFKSLDGAKTWASLNNGLSGRALNVRSMALGRGVILIGTSDGVYKTTDGGKNWQSMGLKGFDVSSVAFAKYNPPVIIVAGIDGADNPGSRLQGAQDFSGRWAPLKQGVPGDLVVSAIASGPVHTQDNLRTVFVAGSGGVYKSDDDGQTWAQLAGLPAQGFGSLALSRADPNILYTASDGGGGSSGGVWRSTDRGGTWAQVSAGLATKAITALSVGADSPATLFAIAWDPDRPAVVAYTLKDTQALPQGSPEGGLCPEGNSDCPPLAASSPGVLPSLPVVLPVPCSSPVTSASGTPTAGASAAASGATGALAASPSASATTGPSPSPSCPPTPQPGGSPRNDPPLWIGLGVVGVLFVVLVGRYLVVRRRREIPAETS
jgi:photosystem II stability/assembly factor-like uncharacterized protein